MCLFVLSGLSNSISQILHLFESSSFLKMFFSSFFLSDNLDSMHGQEIYDYKQLLNIVNYSQTLQND